MVWFNRMRALLMCSPLALAACAAGPKPPVVAQPQPAVEAEAGGGIYKIGKPYQVEGIWYYPAEDYSYTQEGIASWYGADFHGKRTANGDRYDMNEVTAAHPTLPMPSVVKVTNLDNGRVLKVTVNDRGPYHSTRIIDLSRRAAQLLGFYEAGTARVRVEIDSQESINLKNIALQKHPPEMPQIVAAPRASVFASALEPAAPTAGNELPPTAVKPVALPQANPTPVEAAPPKPAVTKTAKASPQTTATALAQPTAPTAAKPTAKSTPKSTSVAAAGGLFIQAGAFSEEANARKLEQQLGDLGAVHIVPTTVNKKRLYRVRLGPVADTQVANALLGKVKSYGYNDAKVVRE